MKINKKLESCFMEDNHFIFTLRAIRRLPAVRLYLCHMAKYRRIIEGLHMKASGSCKTQVIEYVYIMKITKFATTFRYINESGHVCLAENDHQSANGQYVKASESHRKLD